MQVPMHDPALEARTRQGLCDLVILPKDMGMPDGLHQRAGQERFRLMGWRFSPLPEEFEMLAGLFVGVLEKPPGWILVPMPMQRGNLWHHLLDQHGRVRAHPFYYRGSGGMEGRDPAAHCILRARFAVRRVTDENYYPIGVEVADAERPVWSMPRHPSVDTTLPTSQVHTAARKRQEQITADFQAATAWLAERAPRHQDVTAYWGDEEIGILGLPDPGGAAEERAPG